MMSASLLDSMWQQIISIAASTPEAAAKQKKQKKALGWEKCSLHCKKMSPTQMGSYAHLLIYTSTLISMKGFNNYYMIDYWFYYA